MSTIRCGKNHDYAALLEIFEEANQVFPSSFDQISIHSIKLVKVTHCQKCLYLFVIRTQSQKEKRGHLKLFLDLQRIVELFRLIRPD